MRVLAPLALAAVFGVIAGGCSDDPAPLPRTIPGDPDAGSFADKPVTAVVAHAIKRATAAASRLQQSFVVERGGRADYLELRRMVAAAAPFLPRAAGMGREVLLGPRRSSDEGGGVLAQVDAALAAGTTDAARQPLTQVINSLRVIDNEIVLNEVPPAEAVQAISDAAYELGLALLEAGAGAPVTPEAVHADITGLLEGIDAIAAAAVRVVGPEQRERAAEPLAELAAALEPLKAAVSAVKSSNDLRDRAALVRQSGAVGVAARHLARALGVDAKLPYPARMPVAQNGIDEPVTPFTIPGPRRDARPGDPAALAALGKKLFFDARLSRGNKRACAGCHVPDKAFADGLPVPASLDPKDPLLRNTPTLLYAPLAAAQLWDGRFASAERQAVKVIHTAAEMGLEAADLDALVQGDAGYKAALEHELGSAGSEGVARALVAYQVAELVPASAPIDRFARGEDQALGERERAGLDVFVGVGRCARCHIPPYFGGSRPTDFSTTVFGVLGVPEAPGSKKLDADRGRGAVTSRARHEHAFKTPTVRNVARTAPYFHHGRWPTLEEVVDFYDKGGGSALGVDVPNQDPDVRPLKLEPAQKEALLLFMRVALDDGPDR